MTGFVNDELEAVIKVRFLLKEIEMLEMVIDTGFSGTLMIPRDFVTKHGLPIKGQEEFLAVENTVFVAERTTLTIEWLNDEFEIPALISEHNYALIGVEMMLDAILTVNYLNKIVLIKR